MDMKIKVLILYNRLFHYRVPIWNILANRYDLTVAFCQEDKVEDNLNFKTILLHNRSWKRFVIQKENIFEICQTFDVVIAYGDIAWLKYSTLPWHSNRKFKIAYWGIGVSASYGKHYDTETMWDGVRDFFYKRADALVFYSDYPVEKYVKRGFKRETLFVAPNTTAVESVPVDEERNNLLFVGTLYKAKGIQALLDAYQRAFVENNDIPDMDIIGAGPDYEIVNKWIAEQKLTHKIHMHGAIYDRRIKAEYFAHSIACISPSQAGLSVLESMGYGTPFITTNNAITGGEVFNIKDGENGVLMNDISDLKDIIIDIASSKKKYIEMGRAAYQHYHRCRKPEDMAKGLADVVEYLIPSL